MAKVIVVGDKDTNHDTMQSQMGTTVNAGSGGGIGGAASAHIGVMAESDDDPTIAMTPAMKAKLDAEFAANGGVDDGAPTDTGQGLQKPGQNVVCGQMPSFPTDSYQLTTHFTLGQLSSKALAGGHRVVPQNGLSVSEIVCNLKALCFNILEPLMAQYPGFVVNSGFRNGGTGSHHNMGEAADVQWPGQAPSTYMAKAQWVRANLPFDAIIFEHGNSIWLHLQYQRRLTKQRGLVQTMYKGKYQPGLKIYYH